MTHCVTRQQRKVRGRGRGAWRTRADTRPAHHPSPPRPAHHPGGRCATASTAPQLIAIPCGNGGGGARTAATTATKAKTATTATTTAKRGAQARAPVARYDGERQRAGTKAITAADRVGAGTPTYEGPSSAERLASSTPPSGKRWSIRKPGSSSSPDITASQASVRGALSPPRGRR